jgi:hypothetical protein
MQQYCYQLYYSYLFCCFVEIKKYPCGTFFLIVYLHLQWNAVLTQIMLCLAEVVLRNSRFFLHELLLNLYLKGKKNL